MYLYFYNEIFASGIYSIREEASILFALFVRKFATERIVCDQRTSIISIASIAPALILSYYKILVQCNLRLWHIDFF